MKRLAVFAHFDKYNIVDPYVVSYLEELRKYVDDIIFVSDGDLSDEEKLKVESLCLEVVAKKHSQYDFGSYKVGFELAKDRYSQKFKEIDELLFVNDSCYLVGSLEEVFTNMSKKDDCDFWGMVDDYHSFNEDKKYYIGSFFMAFRKEVFQQQFFADFVSGVKKLENRDEIVDQCEFGLSQLLLKEGKRVFAYFNMNKTARYIADNHIDIAGDIYDIFAKNSYLKKRKVLFSAVNDVCNVHTYNYLHSNKFYVLLRMGFPLYKRRNIQYESFTRRRLMFLWEEALLASNNVGYNISQIKDHFRKTGRKIKSKKIISNRFSYFLYLLAIARPFYVKRFKKNGRKYTTYKILFFKVKFSKAID